MCRVARGTEKGSTSITINDSRQISRAGKWYEHVKGTSGWERTSRIRAQRKRTDASGASVEINDDNNESVDSTYR